MKGHVQGYGSYDELTSSGVDPRELFDDIKDTGSLQDFITTDVVIEECNDVVEEAYQQDIISADDIPKERTIRSRHSENDPSPTFEDEGSMYTTPSMLSLISIPDQFEDIKRINVVCNCWFF